MRGLFLAKDALELLAASLEAMDGDPHSELKRLLDQLRQKDRMPDASCFGDITSSAYRDVSCLQCQIA